MKIVQKFVSSVWQKRRERLEVFGRRANEEGWDGQSGIELRLRHGLDYEVIERYRRDSGLRRRSHRVRRHAKQTMRFAFRAVRVGRIMRVDKLRSCEHNQCQDEKRRRQLTQCRTIVLEWSIHDCKNSSASPRL